GIAPGVDVDRLIVDTLFVHVLQAGRCARTECDRAGEVVLGGRRERRVLYQIPHLGYERMGVNVDDGHPTAGDRRATTCSLSEAVATDGKACGCARNGLQEITAIRHWPLSLLV